MPTMEHSLGSLQTTHCQTQSKEYEAVQIYTLYFDAEKNNPGVRTTITLCYAYYVPNYDATN